jgi:hypothetical protein
MEEDEAEEGMKNNAWKVGWNKIRWEVNGGRKERWELRRKRKVGCWRTWRKGEESMEVGRGKVDKCTGGGKREYSRPHREKRPECRPFLEFLGSEKHWIINISDALIKMFL